MKWNHEEQLFRSHVEKIYVHLGLQYLSVDEVKRGLNYRVKENIYNLETL
jgi:hypothetical protein